MEDESIEAEFCRENELCLDVDWVGEGPSVKVRVFKHVDNSVSVDVMTAGDESCVSIAISPEGGFSQVETVRGSDDSPAMPTDMCAVTYMTQDGYVFVTFEVDSREAKYTAVYDPLSPPNIDAPDATRAEFILDWVIREARAWLEDQRVMADVAVWDAADRVWRVV